MQKVNENNLISFLTAFRILWSKYHYSSEPLTCKIILSRIDLSNIDNKKIIETKIDFPALLSGTCEMVFIESKKIFRNQQNIVDQFSVSDSYVFNLIALNAESKKIELDCSIKIYEDIYLTFKAPVDSPLSDVVSNSESHFLKILNAIQQSPERKVADILIHNTEELDYLLQWSEGKFDPSLSQPGCLHHLFEQTTKTYPDLPAVYCNGKSFTYKEIDNKANQLAHYLRLQGIGKGDYCGILLPRT